MVKTLHALLIRCQSDIRLALVVLFAVLAILAVTPFAVYRVVRGEWANALLDAGLVALVACNMAYAWSTGRTRLVGIVNTLVVSLVFVTLASHIGAAALYWSYTITLANFMLAPRWLAAASGALVLATAVSVVPFPDAHAAASYVASACLVLLFSLIFASLTQTQRIRLEMLATRDALTGIGNRRCLDMELADSLAWHRAKHRPATVVVLDLDHFKAINDSHGHEAGDRVLLALTGLVQAALRKHDRLYRLGGDEFVLLLPGTGAAGARIALHKLQGILHQHLHGPGGRVGVSMGAAVLEPDDDWSAWLARADDALYQAKKAGRGRLHVAGAGDLPAGARRDRRLRLVANRAATPAPDAPRA